MNHGSIKNVGGLALFPALFLRKKLSIETKSFTMSMDLPEFQACVTAYRNWFQEILNSMDVPWSNGFIEGCNNKTKALKCVCFGMRNFRNFRNRILFCSGVPKKPRRG